MAGSGPSSLKLLFGKKNTEDQAEAVEEEILSIVEEGHEQGTIMSDEAELISNVFEFGDKKARDVMTPRQKVIGIEATVDVAEALNIMLENNYSRYPIYEEDLDNIVGVLHIKEAVTAYLVDNKQLVGTIGSEPYYIHPTQKISKLFNEMQDNKSHIAIVVDEYGQTEGIVAMEDVIIDALKSGEIIRLGDLGAFQIGLSGKGTLTEEEYDSSLIKKARINFRPGIALSGMLTTLTYARVPKKPVAVKEENDEGFEE